MDFETHTVAAIMVMVMVMAMVTVVRVRMATQTPIALTQAVVPEAGPYKAAFVSHIGDTEKSHG